MYSQIDSALQVLKKRKSRNVIPCLGISQSPQKERQHGDIRICEVEGTHGTQRMRQIYDSRTREHFMKSHYKKMHASRGGDSGL
jgi:hypothetical protein